jgi:hypothetical protein
MERSDSGLCVPVFALNYHGWYSMEGLKFLERVMRDTFNDKKFLAGRGPAEVFFTDNGDVMYVNGLARDGKTSLQSSCGFSDRERIVRIDRNGKEEILGIHDFNLVLLTKRME